VNHFDNGKIKTCVLSNDFTIEGYKFPINSKVNFNYNGSLSHVELGSEAIILNQFFPKGTIILLNHWGEKFNFWLSKPMKIQDHHLDSRNDGIGDCLYPNSGKLKKFWLAQEEIIDGIPCTSSANIIKYGWSAISKGTDRMIYLFENGKLKQAMLSKDYIIKDKHFTKGNIITFDENGIPNLKRK
jgi:hypothetical protein